MKWFVAFVGENTGPMLAQLLAEYLNKLTAAGVDTDGAQVAFGGVMGSGNTTTVLAFVTYHHTEEVPVE